MGLADRIATEFILTERAGWLAISSRFGSLFRGYSTKRIAKIMPDGELRFTIGATLLGKAGNLNATIRAMALDCGFDVLDRHSTSGSRRHPGDYPAIRTSGEVDRIIRLLLLVEGAAIQVATNGA